jgi:hypothetical protein
MSNLKLRKILIIFVPMFALLVGISFPVVSKVLDSRRLQETNFELSILEFKGENLSSPDNPAQAFFRYAGDILIPLKIVNNDLDLRVVVELPRFPADVSSHFLDGSLLISGGDISVDNPQIFPILLVRQPTANTRLEKINKIIADGATMKESTLSKQMGELISRLQRKYSKKYNFHTETKEMDKNFEELYSELSELNVSFESSLEELEAIDRELQEVLS